MSQKKVDKYKQEKANRQKIMKKEKFRRWFVPTIVLVIIGAGITYFGIAAYMNSRPVETKTIEIDTSAVDEYANSIES